MQGTNVSAICLYFPLLSAFILFLDGIWEFELLRSHCFVVLNRTMKPNGSVKILFPIDISAPKEMTVCLIAFCRVYFAISLLNVISELLDKSKQDPLMILGCQTLTRFIYSQVCQNHH